MPNYRGRHARIKWNDGEDRVVDFGYPLDGAVSWSEPTEGSEYVIAPSGAVDGWVVGTTYRLSGRVRWIPREKTTTEHGFSITGWDDNSAQSDSTADDKLGWRRFFEFAREGNTFIFIPDIRESTPTEIESFLVSPLAGEPTLETADATKTFTLVIGNTTTPYEGY